MLPTHSTAIPNHSLMFGDSRTRPRPLAERPLKEWPSGERPAERLAALGPSALSDSELLAILFGTTGSRSPVPLAESLLADRGGWVGLMQRSAATVVALCEIGRRLTVAERVERAQVRSPTNAARLIMAAIGHCDQEHLVTLLLDTKNRVIKLHTVYIGTQRSSLKRMSVATSATHTFRSQVWRLKSTAAFTACKPCVTPVDCERWNAPDCMSWFSTIP